MFFGSIFRGKSVAGRFRDFSLAYWQPRYTEGLLRAEAEASA